MTCDERRDRIALLAADALDDAERDELRAHLETGCADCSAELEAVRALLADLALSLAPVPPPVRVRERLLSRVEGGRRAAPRRGPPRARRWRTVATTAAASVASAALAAAVVYDLAPEPMDRHIEELELEIAELHSELAAQDEEIFALEAELQTLSKAIGVLRSPEVKVMDLHGEGGARGRLYWVWDDYECYLHATELGPLEPGRVYVLWLVTEDGELVRAGSFATDRRGEASFYTRLHRDLAPVERALLSPEPDPPGEAPTGPPRLEGEAQDVRPL